MADKAVLLEVARRGTVVKAVDDGMARANKSRTFLILNDILKDYNRTRRESNRPQ
jgi:hypothetical protein